MPYKCAACDKIFRYKVSQRTHKCPGQSSGGGESSAAHSTTNSANASPIQLAIPEDITDKIFPSDSVDDAPEGFNASQALDELIEESYNKMVNPPVPCDANDASEAGHSSASLAAMDNLQIPSPSDKFQNLCLYSPSNSNDVNDIFAQTLQTINEDSFKQLLYGNVDDLNNII